MFLNPMAVDVLAPTQAGIILRFRRVGGAKAFSSCSVKDFESFLQLDAGDCLFDRPRLAGLFYRQAAACGNGVVERGEQCDCGSEAVSAAAAVVNVGFCAVCPFGAVRRGDAGRS